MLLIWIVLSAVAGGLFALAVAHWLAYRVFAGYLHHMVSLSVGVLLAVSLLHLLPEAAETGLAPHALFACMLASIIGFFVLEKIALLRHSHHHEGDGHHHHSGHDRHEAGKGGMLILIGSSLHNLVDGVLIAAALVVAFFIPEIPMRDRSMMGAQASNEDEGETVIPAEAHL